MDQRQGLEALQNRAARIVARTVRSNPAMDVLKWPKLEERRRKPVFKLVKKYLQGQIPQYFKQYFKHNNTIHTSATRQGLRSQKDIFIIMVALLFNELA